MAGSSLAAPLPALPQAERFVLVVLVFSPALCGADGNRRKPGGGIQAAMQKPQQVRKSE